MEPRQPSEPPEGGGRPAGDPGLSDFVDKDADSILDASFDPPRRPGRLACLGEYEILRRLGEGGMGVVFLAQRSSDGLFVAIKTLQPRLARKRGARNRFIREAEHLAKIDHPHIVSILGADPERETPFFVMPFFPLGSLADEVRRKGALPTPRILRLAPQIAEALRHAHARWLFHRDLKPANILLDDADRASVADFGLALDFASDGQEREQWGGCEGTAAYLSPGTAGGKSEDSRGDIYGFGAVLYEMLTGQAPYRGSDATQIRAALLAGPPPPILEVNPSASKELAAIAEKCMARELRLRYAEMGDVIADLAKATRGEPPLALRAAPARSLPPRRLPRALAAALLIALVLLMTGYAIRTGAHRLVLTRAIIKPGFQDWQRAGLGRIRGMDQPVIVHTDGSHVLTLSLAGDQVRRQRLLDTSQRYLTEAMLKRIEGATNLLGDDSDELLVSGLLQTKPFVSLFDVNFHELQRFTPEHLEPIIRATRRQITTLGTARVIRFRPDQSPDLVAVIADHTTNALHGLVCYDALTGKPRWTYLTGNYLRYPTVADLNNDGVQELLVGSYSTANGNLGLDGSSDEEASAAALTAEGQLLWRRVLGGKYCAVHVLPFTPAGDGPPAVLTWLEGSQYDWKRIGQPETGRLTMLSAAGDILHDRDFEMRLYSVAVRRDPPTDPRILVTDRQGRLHVLDAQLNLLTTRHISSATHDDAMLMIAADADLDRDGRRELILTSCQREMIHGPAHGSAAPGFHVKLHRRLELLLLNPELDVIARRTIARRQIEDESPLIQVVDVDGDEELELLWMGCQHLLLFEYRKPWWKAWSAD